MINRSLSAPQLLLITMLACGLAGPANGQGLVADLSSNHVAISTGFTGTDVLLFGAIDGRGDIVVVITGPLEPVVVRRKRRMLGIWANAENVTFENTPNFYAIASNRPLAEITTPDVLASQQIGIANLNFSPDAAFLHWSADQLAAFSDALIRNKQRDGLYSLEPSQVSIISNRLFRTSIYFPANMATGNYTAVVYQFSENGEIQAVSTPLRVEKVGLGAEVFDFAHGQSALYGIAAIITAIAAGWLGGVIFRRV